MQQANHPRTLSAPSPNVSANMLLAMQSATTKIKELITQNIVNGGGQDDLTKELNKVIAEACAKISDKAMREEVRKAFVTSARKWFYEI